MAQTNEGRGGLARLSVRTIALIVGFIGSALALIVNLLYGLFHILGAIAGVPNDSAHFLWGLLIVLMGVAGSLMAPIFPIPAGLLLAVAGIAFFFVVGWWALIVSPFLLVAAALTLSNRRVDIPAAG
jgi:hypothetical protein